MSTYDGALEPVGGPEAIAPTPQYWGFPENPKPYQLEVWWRQEAFLEAYAKCGKIGKAAKASGITRWCVDKWLHNDVYAIKTRMEDAHADYVETLETEMDEVCADRKGNHDILRIFRLKAEHPVKYREEVKVLGMEAPKEMLARLKELAGKDRAEREGRERLEAPAIEAEYREVGVDAPELPAIVPAPLEPSEVPPVPPAAVKDKRAAKGEIGREAKGKPWQVVTRR
jgi:hypothetical protein